jgi:lipopolysaccharide/colanic/teichoic acid biosynthesis glycosyltransferase
MVKRLFDVFFSLILLLMFFLVLILVWILAVIDTNSNGVFIQERIGRHGVRFKIYKIRTIRTSTQSDFKSISKIGRFFRKSKLDELPQLFNILKSDMSVVGPRPDIAGYYDILEGEERKILELKPGLTSLASIKYANEDELLAKQKEPLQYNNEVIFPDKVKMNLDYYYKQSFFQDIIIIWQTIFRK